MKTIYKAANITEAHIVSGLLESHGIQSHVAGHYLQGATGETAAMDFARVRIAESDYDAALPIIAEYEQNKPEDGTEETLVGELEEGAVKPSDVPTMMQFFTKPILFWISLFLLAWLFLF